MIISATPEWQSLRDHHTRIQHVKLTSLFENDSERFEKFGIEAAGLFVDLSKNFVDDNSLDALIKLAHAAGFTSKRQAFLSGEAINATESRAAMHYLLRGFPGLGNQSTSDVDDVLQKMADLTGQITTGQWTGATGQSITTVVSIGIGGSYLGPKMVWEALADFRTGSIDVKFVANIDPTHLQRLLTTLDPERTLFIITSKSFSTLETVENAAIAKRWLLNSGISDPSKHLLAISANVEGAEQFGISAENIYPMWDWVGGRYSLWSAVGLPLMIGLGVDTFQQLLRGAHAMDEHFAETEAEQNLPLLLALIDIWYANFFEASSHAVLPYSHDLRILPAHLQQLEMESNGKSMTLAGVPVEYSTAPVVWGSEGTNGQHAFFQLLHQGTHFIPIDLIFALTDKSDSASKWLLANCIGQGRALMLGQSEDEVIRKLMADGVNEEQARTIAPHKVMKGNRPSTTIIMQDLTPHTVGALVALYEHKVFCQGMIWGINSFDQWGVELGKVVSEDIFELMQGHDFTGVDQSTAGLLTIAERGSTGRQ